MVLAELNKHLLSSMNLSSVLSIYPSFRNAHSEQYHQTSDILVHDIRPLTNPTLLATDMVFFYTKLITDCHADSYRRMRIVWWSSVGRFLHLTSGASTKFNLHFVGFPSTYFKWPDLWRLLTSEVTNLTSIFRPTGSAKNPSMSETLCNISQHAAFF